MTRQTWEEERDAQLLKRNERLLERILFLLEEVLKQLPPPPTFRPTVGILVVPIDNARQTNNLK